MSRDRFEFETHSFGYDDECNDCRVMEKENNRLIRENRHLRELLEESREEIQNCYSRDIPLTERIWQALEGGSAQ